MFNIYDVLIFKRPKVHQSLVPVVQEILVWGQLIVRDLSVVKVLRLAIAGI